MKQSTKIIIGIVIAVVIIWLGYLFLNGQSGNNPSTVYPNISHQGGPSFSNYMNRFLHQTGVLPGGGGGGG